MIDLIREYHVQYIFRMLLSCLCGILVGYERKNRAKEAGIRTHCIVACASAMMMIVSKYGFGDMINGISYPGADVRLDPSRMAQGIVTGVGFLGAGIIYIQRGTIRGLTTAAGIWAMSGIGMAIGAGEYMVGIAATVIILLAQIILHSNSRFMSMYKTKMLTVYGVREKNFHDKVVEMFTGIDINVTDVSIRKNEDESLDYSFCFDMPKTVNEEELIKMFNYKCAIEFTH